MDIKKLHIAVPTWVLHRKIEVMYLVIGPEGLDKFKDVIHIGITEQMMEVVNKHVTAYVRNGELPPANIASSILNIADDMLAGRAPTIRTGDYIALQQHVSAGGK